MRFIFVSLILILIIANDVAALTSCEGFIKSNTEIDYSKIQAKLFTAQGNLKHEAECNPGNGYFFIPIYNKGKYLIKLSTPEGWIFVPELHEVEIVNDGECPGELNFELVGFQIKGAIQNGQNSHLELGLYQGNNNKLIEKTKSDGNGEYKFIAKPGKYVISPISGSSSEHCVDQGSINVEIVDAPVRVKPDIRVAGHNLKVQLIDEKGNPVPSATAILIAEKEIKFENLPINSERPVASNRAQKWFYSLKTDSTGIVMFYCIPTGKYSISGELRRQTMEAHFEEKQIEMNSKAAKVKILINAFTLNGKVTIGKKPIPGVKISIDGTFKMETDGNGKFELAKISPGKHIIGGEKQNYEFNKMEIIGSIEMEKEILLSPKRMAIAGNVISSEKLTLPISFQLKKLDGSDLQKFETGNDGKFYEMIEPGKYSIKPLSSIPFSPNEFAINLMESPILDMKFIQYKAKVGGRVKCFSGKCNEIWLEIWQQESGNFVTKLQLPSNGIFLFDEVLPGKYKLKIVDQENIWWAEEEMGIEIMDKDLVDINFEQKGFRLNIQTTHPVKMRYWPITTKSAAVEKEISLVEGMNAIKFLEAGKFGYSLDSCYEFEIDEGGEMEKEKILNVPSKKQIHLTAKSFAISVAVVEMAEEKDAHDNSMQMILREKDNELAASHQMQQGAFKNGQRLFELRLNGEKIGKNFEILPKSARLLFLPESISFVFDGKCSREFAVFKTQMGKFIEGKVEPIVSEAEVEARHRDKPEIVFTTKTDAQGKYKIGPFWEIDDFLLEISKEGFKFEPKANSPHNFGSIQLSQLHIKFLDMASRDPLSEVLVSISGGTTFRSKNLTDSTGILRFIGLAPGPYYIRPILQEYKFNSSSFSVEIVEGQTQELILEAKRFAYSIFGKVSTIGSKPFRIPIRVEAVSAQCENHQEEALLNPKNDEYRIRGLKPECFYKITLHDANTGQQIKAFPPLMNLKMETEDISAINFVLLPIDRPDPVAAGEIVLPAGMPQPAGGFRAQLLEADSVVQELLLHGPASIFFFNLPSYNREYTIKVFRVDAKQPKNAAVSAKFFAGSSFNYIRLEPKAEQKASEVEVLKANYFGLALILLITLAFLNQSKTKSLFEYALNAVRELIERRGGGNFAGMMGATDDSQKRRKPRKI